jgi:DNA-3-methyladenine glycosylase II
LFSREPPASADRVLAKTIFILQKPLPALAGGSRLNSFWFYNEIMTPLDLQKARRHLSRRDEILKNLIRQIGSCTLEINPDGFSVLVRSIISQQISTRAAMAIGQRVLDQLGRGGFRPKNILQASEETLRSAGLSANKALSLRDLSEKCASGLIPLKKLPRMADEEIIEHLIQVRGIGRWTAEMFLIFSLGRSDILSHGDYGLRAGVMKQYQLPELPDKKTLTQICEPWRPYRSIGTWFIWRSLGSVPQSGLD